MSSTSWAVLIIGLFLCLGSYLSGAETHTPAEQSAEVPLATIGVTPAYGRIEVATGQHADVVLTLHLPDAATILAVSADCDCLQSSDVLPMAAGRDETQLHLRATGILPGMKTVTVRTTVGRCGFNTD